MKESRYVPEDKRDLSGKCPELPYALFVDDEYTDKDYHKQFPTIYHLRKTLMETEEIPDIRLVYLALHHIMKHRGHFLLSGDIESIKDFRHTFSTFVQIIRDEELDFSLYFEENDVNKVEKILKDRKLTKSEKKARLIKELAAKSDCEKSVLNLISGGTVKLSSIFGDGELDNSEKPKISFADSGYDEYVGILETELAERYCVIEAAKAVYDWSLLVDILGESASISEAKVTLYEKHKKDLAYLKRIVKKYLTKQDYTTIFVKTDEKINNYCAYIGMTKVNGKKVDLQGKQCSREEFEEFLKKSVVKKIADRDVTRYIEEELEMGTFLPKQVNKDNGVLPYQIHLYELKRILENLEERIPLLKENHEKLIQLFEFRIPYYVGPLNVVREGEDSKFTWAVRKSDDRIYPWNFEDVIDTEASAERFIRRMTNKCTYLYGEDVLPKESLLYSKFLVLNELNNLRINGQKINVELKQQLYTDLFCKYRKVTQKRLKDYLVREGIAERNVEISGIDGDFTTSMLAYHDFKEVLTGAELSQKDKENIILNITLFGEDKKLLKKRLNGLFPALTQNQIQSLCRLSYKGWGRFSKKFLEEIMAPAPGTGEVWNLITALWETNNNLMQLLGQDFMFMDAVKEYNCDKGDRKLSYKTVDELYVSPAVKRQVWQALQIVKELQKVMSCAPKRVFIEMAREKQESKRTESRRKQLMDLYKACQSEEREWFDELGKREDSQLRSDKLYLYYVQKGRCMYSGEVIKLEELWDNTKYDIDHIYPQSKTMDDSLDNRVLVKKQYNAEKGDTYPINASIREKMGLFWKTLLEGKFISKEKYERLIRHEEFTSGELAGFIERQIVETRQGTKAVAEILKCALPDTEIVYTKAKPVSQFRQDFDFVKVREMNDLHHAKDAYLNIVVGNTYFVKFTKDAARFVKENPGRAYNLKKMFTSDHDTV